jgi:molybdate transport system substrate-binding protein
MLSKFLRCIVAALLLTAIPSNYSGAVQRRSEILVSAAFSLKDAFQETAAIYEKKTGVRVQFNFGSSGLLQKQIEAGAPVDIFASAGEKQMDELQSRGLIIPETRRNFTRNDLVLVLPANSKIPIRSFTDLFKPEIKRMAVGNSKTVPAGQYAQETLKNLGLWNALQNRLVLTENARQIMDYVARGEADAGIVYTSDVVAMRKDVRIVATAPKESHSPILYSIAVIKEAANRQGSQGFIGLVLSETGQKILKKYGFLELK